MGCGGVGCTDYQGAQGNFGGNELAHCIDCDDGFTASKRVSKIVIFNLNKTVKKLNKQN